MVDINKSNQTKKNRENKNLKTKNSEVLDNFSDLQFDKDVLGKLLEKDTSEVFLELESLEDVDIIVNQAMKNLSTATITRCISLLENYKNTYLNTNISILVKSFLEENNITDMDEKFLALSEDTRILIAIYRSQIKKYSYSCGGGFGYYKTPTECNGCISGRKNMEKANLVHLAKYIGDRQYQVPSERIQEAQSNFILQTNKNIENPSEKLEKIIKIYKSKAKECDDNMKRNSTISKIKETNKEISRKEIATAIPGFVDHIKDTKNAWSIKLDLKNKVGAYLEGTTRRWGSSGCEYGNYVAVWYNGQRKDNHVVYRDAYSASKDDRSLNFSEIEIKEVKIEEDKIYVTVRASSNSNARAYTFDFPLAKEKKVGLNKEAQEKFSETFEQIKQKILIEQNKRYEKNTMPSYCLPSDMVYNNMPGGDMPYLQPKIETEYLDKTNGIGVIVIIKQIDHCAGHKRQLAREGWCIKQDGSYDRVEYETMRDLERLNGKQIKMNAREIVQKHLQKK